MAYLPLLTIIDPDAERGEDVLDTVAGIAAHHVGEFVGRVCLELGALLSIDPSHAGRIFSFHLDGAVVRCKPIGLGSPLEVQAELRAIAREVAQAIVQAIRPRTASERAA